MRFDILFIILLGAFLRLYRIQDFYMFLADQGRDALIIRRIALLQKFPLIGPPSSIGEVFLGPFYYYVVSPFLWLFNFNPVGLAVGVAVISILSLVVIYFIVQRATSHPLAFIFTTLITTSALLVDVGRFSWNPNLLPYFSFLTLCLFYALLYGKRKLVYGFAFGVLFGLTFQLHHLAALLVLPMAIYYIAYVLRMKRMHAVVPLIIAVVGFGLTLAPFILFELRHDFLNTHNLISLFTKQNVVSSGPYINRFTDVLTAFVSFALHISIPTYGAYLIFFVVCGQIIYGLYKKFHPFILLQLIVFVTLLFGLSRVNAQAIPHYYHTVYISFYFLLAVVIYSVSKKYVAFISIGALLIFTTLQWSSYSFIWAPASRQDETPKRVGAFIANQTGSQTINLATYPIEFTSRDCYQYFIEYYGGHVIDVSDPRIMDTMYVLCDKEPCHILNSHSWNINQFGKATIDTIWTVSGITIYKLKHL